MINLPLVDPDINGKTLVTAASLDEILIADASDGFELKKVTAQTIANLGGGGGSPYQNPADTSWKIYHEEFTNNSTASIFGPISLFGSKTGTGAIQQRKDVVAADSGRAGIYRMASGSTAGSWVYMTTALKGFIFGGGQYNVAFNIKLLNVPDVTDDYILFMGFSDVAHQIGSNMVGLIVDRTISTTNWVALTRKANTSTTTDTGIAFDTNWVSLESKINADGTSVDFLIDGVSAATHTTNIPILPVGFNMRCGRVAGAVREYEADWAFYAFKPTVARATIDTFISN